MQRHCYWSRVLETLYIVRFTRNKMLIETKATWFLDIKDVGRSCTSEPYSKNQCIYLSQNSVGFSRNSKSKPCCAAVLSEFDSLAPPPLGKNSMIRAQDTFAVCNFECASSLCVDNELSRVCLICCHQIMMLISCWYIKTIWEQWWIISSTRMILPEPGIMTEPRTKFVWWTMSWDLQTLSRDAAWVCQNPFYSIDGGKIFWGNDQNNKLA